MKIEITKPGIFGKNGQIAVGTIITIKSELPKGWEGKYRIVEEAPAADAKPVTNDGKAKAAAPAAPPAAAPAADAKPPAAKA